MQEHSENQHLYWFREKDIEDLVEFSARAHHKYALSNISAFYMIGLCSLFNLLIMGLAGHVNSKSSFIAALVVSSIFIGLWAIIRSKHPYKIYRERQQQKFKEMIYNARLNLEIETLTGEDQ